MKSTIDQSKTWFVARCVPRGEEKAAAEIRKAGFDHYLPRARIERWSKRGHVYVTQHKPAMPPYLFVGFDPLNKAFGTVHDLDGVGGFLGVNGEPIPVPAHVVLAILIAETEMVFDDTEASRRKKEGELDDAFPVGSAVKFISDVNALLEGLDGTVLGNNHKDKVHVAFGAIKSWVARSDIKAA